MASKATGVGQGRADDDVAAEAVAHGDHRAIPHGSRLLCNEEEILDVAPEVHDPSAPRVPGSPAGRTTGFRTREAGA